MKNKAFLWPILLIIFSLLTWVLVMGEVQGPVRAIVTFCFVGLCPGMALLRLLFRLELIAQIVLAIACSWAVSSLVAVGTLYAGDWHPESGLAALILFTLALAVFDLLRNRPLRLKPVTLPTLKAQPNRKRHRHTKMKQQEGK